MSRSCYEACRTTSQLKTFSTISTFSTSCVAAWRMPASTVRSHRSNWRVDSAGGLAKPDGLGESGPADPAKIARILKRVGKGNPPMEGDELPPEFSAKKKRISE